MKAVRIMVSVNWAERPLVNWVYIEGSSQQIGAASWPKHLKWGHTLGKDQKTKAVFSPCGCWQRSSVDIIIYWGAAFKGMSMPVANTCNWQSLISDGLFPALWYWIPSCHLYWAIRYPLVTTTQSASLNLPHSVKNLFSNARMNFWTKLQRAHYLLIFLLLSSLKP